MYYPYDILDVQESASNEIIRKAYLKKLHQYPGEQYPAEFQAITEAYSAIKDEVSRAQLKVFAKWVNRKSKSSKFTDLLFVDKTEIKKIGTAEWEALIRQIEA